MVYGSTTMSAALQLNFDPPVEACLLCGSPTLLRRWVRRRVGHDFTYDWCGRCDFAFVNPRPTIESLGRYYQGLSGAGLGEGEMSSREPRPPTAHDAARRVVGELVSHRPSDRLLATPDRGAMLDVGAGSGTFAAAGVEMGLAVTALELDPIDVAGMRMVPGLNVEAALFEDFDAPDQSFDFILMSHVLEHAHDPAGWIERASRLLRPGGVIGIRLPHLNSLWRRIGGARDPYFVPPEHLNHFTDRALTGLCERVGLGRVESHSATQLPPELLVRKLRPPEVIRPVVRGAGAVGSAVLSGLTRATNTGAVLVFHAIKR